MPEIDSALALLEYALKKIRELSVEDRKELLAGNAELVFSSRKKRTNFSGNSSILDSVNKRYLSNECRYDETIKLLEKAGERAEGIEILTRHCAAKKNLQELAKRLDLPVRKKDNIEKLLNMIVEATIGYRIKSDVFMSYKK